MRILFVHQNFPGQYRHIIKELSFQGGHQIIGLGIEPLTEVIPKEVQYFRYGLTRGNTPGIHDWLIETESKLVRAESCARAAAKLRDQGFNPDLICVHPGWGEALFLKDLWPTTPLLSYQEFYYNSHGFDYSFDPEFQANNLWEPCARLRMKNANILLSLQASDWSLAPTKFQKSSFPSCWHSRISCIHDGIDTDLAKPGCTDSSMSLPGVGTFQKGQPIITFVNRTLEPYRGCHTFIRAIPEIQSLVPNAIIIIVGKGSGVSYGAPAPGNSWKDIFLDEIKGWYDQNLVHFVGSLSYSRYLDLLRISACHVYLTYPFVLSWSLMEAMSIALPVVGSRTPPVEELITDGYNGVLIDFFSPTQLAKAVEGVISNPHDACAMGNRARDTILESYSLSKCVPRQLSLIDLIASGGLV